MKELKKHEVYYLEGEIMSLCFDDITLLKKNAKAGIRKRARICTHESDEDLVHEMIIFHPKNTFVPIHKHESAESITIIDGKMDLIIYDDVGTLLKKVHLGPYSSGLPFYYKIVGKYHTMNFLTDVVFLEVTKGPFDKDNTIFLEGSKK